VDKARYTTVQTEKGPQQGYTSGGKMHTVSFFPIESAQHVMLFLWIGSQNDKVFLFGSGYRSAGGDTVKTKVCVCSISSTVMVVK